MEGLTKDSLVVKGQLVNKGKGKCSSRNPKSRGISKSPVHSMIRCWK
jgi:hypothetical protein